jgi:hypothetical protein
MHGLRRAAIIVGGGIALTALGAGIATAAPSSDPPMACQVQCQPVQPPPPPNSGPGMWVWNPGTPGSWTPGTPGSWTWVPAPQPQPCPYAQPAANTTQSQPSTNQPAEPDNPGLLSGLLGGLLG